jgi:predicted dehydrogenase
MTRQLAKTMTARAAPPRIGFLGVGWIGHHRMQAVAQSGRAEIVAIGDANREAAARAAGALPDAQVVDSLDGLLENELDGVVIATPSGLHTEQTIRALEHGVAVFCQKPLARTHAEARDVIQAARSANKLLAVDFCYRTLAGVPRLRELIRAGELGHVYAVDLVFHNAYGPDKGWFYDLAQSGGGCVMDLGIHLVDLALWMLDGPEVREVSSRLYAKGALLAKPAQELEDYAIAQLELQDGIAARLACSWRLPAGCDAAIEAAFYGTNGGAAVRNVNGSFYDFQVERFRGTARETLGGYPDDWGGRAILEWVRRIGQDPSFDPEADLLADVAQVVDAIYGR